RAGLAHALPALDTTFARSAPARRLPGGFMFDGPFDVFALIIAIIAFLIAIKASSQAAELRRRLSSLEEMVYAQRRVQPPPLMPTPVQAETPATTPAEPPPLAPEAEAPPPLVTEEASPPPIEADTGADAPP